MHVHTRATYITASRQTASSWNAIIKQCLLYKERPTLDAHAPRVPLSRIQASPTHWTDGQPRGARNWHAARRRCDHLPTSARQRPLNNTETRHANFFSGYASFQQTLRKREANPSTHTNNYWCSLTQTPDEDEQGHDIEAQESDR